MRRVEKDPPIGTLGPSRLGNTWCGRNDDLKEIRSIEHPPSVCVLRPIRYPLAAIQTLILNLCREMRQKLREEVDAHKLRYFKHPN